MFKKYRFKFQNGRGEACSIDFFVHSKGTRSGFMHQACAIGCVPRIDEMSNDYGRYSENEKVLFKKRYTRNCYCNRTWENWPGHDCLVKLWNQMAKLPFVDMSVICPSNPFESGEEPEHEGLWDPEDLFGPFTKR